MLGQPTQSARKWMGFSGVHGRRLRECPPKRQSPSSKPSSHPDCADFGNILPFYGYPVAFT
jgi:hypothetical protein